MKFLRRVGDLLDVADEKTTESDLQTLAGGALGAAGGAIEAAKDGAAAKVQGLDLGLKEGWNELATQIGGDLKQGVSAAAAVATSAAVPSDSAAHTGLGETHEESLGPIAPQRAASSPLVDPAAQRLADLRERVQELETREAERLQARERVQRRFDEVDGELKKTLEAESRDPSDLPFGSSVIVGDVSGEADAKDGDSDADAEGGDLGEAEASLEAMRREFCERQATADTRLAVLQAEFREVSSGHEPVDAELNFWKEKAQCMLEARGLDKVPEDLRRRVDGRDSSGSAAGDAAASPPAQRDTVEELRAEEVMLAEHKRCAREREAQQQIYEGLERKLAELMRDSDAAMERADEQRRHERELQAALDAAEAATAAEMEKADEASRQAQSAQEVWDSCERSCIAELQRLREARAQDGVESEAHMLRREAEALRCSVENLSKEGSELEGRLLKYRTAAAADLERAVPLSSSSCWSNIDGPTMKVVTLLVRYSCLRRTFAVHLLATYAWLFFLLFWFDKH